MSVMADAPKAALKFGQGAQTPEESKALVAAIVKKGIHSQEVSDMYKKWSPSYEQDLAKLGYKGPQQLAMEMATLVEEADRDMVKILDFAAGTGLLGNELHKLGFRNIDALDANSAMMEVAGKKGIYKNLIQAFLGPNRLDIPNNTYDYLLSTGSFAEGHVKCDCFRELIRITKPGGRIVFTMKEDQIITVQEYAENLSPTISQLESEGQWRHRETKTVEEYYKDTKGLFFYFEVVQ